MTPLGAAPAANLTLVRKLLRLNWALILLVIAIAGFGFLMLYSVAGGDFDRWAGRQVSRFAFGVGLMLFIVTLILNVIALHVVRKYREQYD